jgi:sigma-B regulation protein RsbU (phosphoserine phosphatase)
MRTRLPLLAVLAVLFTPALRAQNTPLDLTGTWQGNLIATAPNPPIRTLVKFAKGDKNTWTGTMYRVDQPGWVQPLTAIALQGNAITFAIEEQDSTYSAEISPDGRLMTGTWAHGAKGTHPLNLLRVAPGAAWEIDGQPNQMAAAGANPSIDVATVKPGTPERQGKLIVLQGAQAQAPQKAGNPKDPRHFDATQTGDIVDIGPYWLFQTGDNPAFATRDFDDSKWPVITRDKSLADQGYPHPSQVWYRSHVRIPANSGTLLLCVRTFHGSYEVFVNGARVGGEGSMSDPGEVRYRRVMLFGIPKEAVRAGNLTIAVRGLVRGTADGMYGAHVAIGGRDGMIDQDFTQYILLAWSDWVFIIVVLFVVVVALAIYRVLPDQKEYLVIALCGAFNLLGESLDVVFIRLRLPQSGVVFAIEIFAAYATYALQYDVVLRLVGVRPSRWIRVLQALLMGAAVFIVLDNAGVSAPMAFATLNYVARVGLNLVVPVYLFLELRRGNRDAPVLFTFQIVSSVLYTLFYTGPFLYQAHLVNTRYVLPPLRVGRFHLDPPDVALLYFWVTLLIIIVLRTVRTTRERTEIAGEIAAARSVQQVLIPDFLEPVPGLTVESAYLPAQEVGGDFFQVLPIADGGAFIVVGDVSGKGLKAAMTVSLIVGTLRTYAEFYTSPAELLAGINRRLHGRTPGFATCLALMITREGEVTIANAGHPNPYLDGVEIQTDSNLPLGITLDVEYTETRLHIDAGQAFTLVTDGVIEATAPATKELFGFDRTQAISRQAANAIAEAARAFGLGAPQADDITVLTVARV